MIYLALRRIDALWVPLVGCVALSALGCMCVVGGWLGVRFGSLSFLDEYREVGEVDGHEVFVQFVPVWGRHGDVNAGFLRGVRLDLTATGAPQTVTDAPPIDRWRFRLTETRSSVVVHYSAGDAGGGVLTLPR